MAFLRVTNTNSKMPCMTVARGATKDLANKCRSVLAGINLARGRFDVWGGFGILGFGMSGGVEMKGLWDVGGIEVSEIYERKRMEPCRGFF